MKRLFVCASLGVLALSLARTPAAPATITVNADRPGHAISPSLWGIFFEDINCSADGGLYAELVRNRNFQDSDKPDHWTLVSSGDARAEMAIATTDPVSPRNPRYLRLAIQQTGAGRVGVANAGFWGMSVVKGEAYRLTLFARSENSQDLQVSLESSDSVPYAKAVVKSVGREWKQHEVTLRAKQTDPRARLVIAASRPGTLCLDMVSLFPSRTWKNRPNGLRPDLAEMLAGLKPAFVRFPGGCWVEGDTMAQAYRWKQTIGDVSERRTQHNIWQYEATHGIGYHEYLQLCEDLNADALFVINCGMSHRENVPMDKMQEYVQDALDAIEYANGPATSTWGAVRARNGHPAPFRLKYLEIGNENGGPAYHERYALFYDAIKARYPEIRLIANLWSGRPENRPVEILDEHYYSTPEFFINQATKYDRYDRKGPRIYVGEYAVTQNGGEGNLRAAVGEAAFMTGMERNSDVVVMASYAPLFANVNYKKWNPDLINFDSHRVYGLPGYYVQKMFAENRGDVVLPVSVAAEEIQEQPRGGGVGVGTWLTQAEFKDMKVTRGDEVLFTADLSRGTEGWRRHGGNWSVVDGALRQNGSGENIRAFVGSRAWTHYTYTLKARKLGGAEGFLIPFLVQDDQAKSWWNIGGWGNTRHAVEMGGFADDGVQGKIETGRWYDIRIEITPQKIRCFLDGQLIHDLEYPKVKPLVACASREKDTVIVKVVNVSSEALETDVRLEGARASKARRILLTSPRPEDENTLPHPTRVAPVTEDVKVAGSSLRQVFPGNSVTVLRFAVK